MTPGMLRYGENDDSLLASEIGMARAGEMAQQLRALAALLEVLSSGFSNHMVAHNH